MIGAVIVALAAWLMVWQPDLAAVCDGASTCGDMHTCAQAYACWLDGNARLDRDGDCIPCESVCKE